VINPGSIFDYADRGIFGSLTAYSSRGLFLDLELSGTKYRPLCLITLDPRPIAVAKL